MNNDLAALQGELAELRAQIAQLLPAAPPLPPVVDLAEPAARVKVYTLIGGPESGYLHRDARVVRQLVEAVGLAKGAPIQSVDVPADWLPSLRSVAAARASGLAWRAASPPPGSRSLTASQRRPGASGVS